MKLIEENGVLKIENQQYNEEVHVIHCAETLSDIKQDIYDPYLVGEECTNFARLHLLTATSEYDALETVAEYLSEEEGDEESYQHVIFVKKLEI